MQYTFSQIEDVPPQYSGFSPRAPFLGQYHTKIKWAKYLLLLAHKFLAFLETVRLTFGVNDGEVMQDTIQDSGGEGDVGKKLVPLGEGLIGSEDGGCLFIPPGNQLEKQICTLNVHREIANLIND